MAKSEHNSVNYDHSSKTEIKVSTGHSYFCTDTVTEIKNALDSSPDKKIEIHLSGSPGGIVTLPDEQILSIIPID